MKKSPFILLILVLLPILTLNAKDLELLVGMSADYLTGSFREIVYPDSVSVNSYLSELIWNLDNIYVVNAEGSLSYKGFKLYCSAGTAVNQGTAVMTDTDWTDYGDTAWTHWSISNIFLERSLFLDTNISYTDRTSDIISASIGIGYRLNFLDWEDRVIDYVYPTPPVPDIIGENGIGYQVTQNIFYLDTGIQVKDENVTGTINFRYSPFVYAWSLDHHLLRTTAPYFFKDSFYSYMWYEIDIAVRIETGKSGCIVIAYSRQELSETAGNTEYYDENPSNTELIGTFLGTTEYSAGLASVISSFSISYIHKLW